MDAKIFPGSWAEQWVPHAYPIIIIMGATATGKILEVSGGKLTDLSGLGLRVSAPSLNSQNWLVPTPEERAITLVQCPTPPPPPPQPHTPALRPPPRSHPPYCFRFSYHGKSPHPARTILHTGIFPAGSRVLETPHVG